MTELSEDEIAAALYAIWPDLGCTTPGCKGDARYAAPGRGHIRGCKYPDDPSTEPARPRQPRTEWSNAVDRKRVISLYEAGKTVPEIRAETGHALGSIRGVLREANVAMRDDRKGRSGGNNRVDAYRPELVDQVRRLYLDEHLTQTVVAQRLGISVKVVYNVMRKHEIPARPRASEPGAYKGVDRAAALKARIAELGGSAVIREWARSAGIPIPPQGIPPASVVEAYALYLED